LNQRYLFPAGDGVLVEMARLLSSLARRGQLVVRDGGGQFSLILFGADGDEAYREAERIRQAITSAPLVVQLRHGAMEISVTVSIGVAMLAPDDADAWQVFLRARDAVHQAKHSGRNRVAVSTKPTGSGLPEGAPMFGDEYRQRLAFGGSSKWAADLTEEQLEAVLWMIGEFGRRAAHVLMALDRCWSESPPHDPVASARAKLALEGLFRVVNGDRPRVDEFFRRWGAIAERVWAAAQSRAPDLPAEELGDRWPLTWEGELVGWLKDPTHQLDGCTGLWVSSGSLASAAFLAALGCPSPAPQWVVVGGIQALVKQTPSSSGQIGVSWCPRSA
jgi:diguanylate cyclase (GGDEF)-like protein